MIKHLDLACAVLATCFSYLDHVIKTVEGTNGAHDNDLRDN